VAYKPVLQIEQHSCDARLERVGWQWFTLENLLEALESDLARPKLFTMGGDSSDAAGDALEVTLWNKAADSMRQAMNDKLLVANLVCRNGA